MKTGYRILALISAVIVAGPLYAYERPAQDPETVSTGQVSAVIDGDTVVLTGGAQVRLVGIQAPKLPLGRKNFRQWPLADEARDYLRGLTGGKTVGLKYGGTRIDRHRRLLAHLYLDDGTWVQGAMLRAGMARVYSFPDNRKHVPEMLAAEREARAARKGIWALDWYKIRQPGALNRDIGSFQIIEGHPRNIAIVRGRAYLNYGADWRKDFTVTIAPRTMRRFWRGKDVSALYAGRKLRVRGWLRRFNGPQIVISHPEQIEVLP